MNSQFWRAQRFALRPAEYPALISPGARCLCGRPWLGGVYKILTRDGHSVSIVQNPTISLEGDVAVTKRTLAAQDRPTILVGHSYGGAVITEAGNHPKVAGLAYIAAFAPDKGESVATLNKHAAPGAAVSPILPPQDGYLFQDKAKFPASSTRNAPGTTNVLMC